MVTLLILRQGAHALSQVQQNLEILQYIIHVGRKRMIIHVMLSQKMYFMLLQTCGIGILKKYLHYDTQKIKSDLAYNIANNLADFETAYCVEKEPNNPIGL